MMIIGWWSSKVDEWIFYN